jgi:DNA-binding MarR family transcriptional regulator
MTSNYDFTIKWSPLLLGDGFTVIPNTLIEHQADLKITSSELNTIVGLLSFKWDDRKPWPSAATLSGYSGLAVHTIRTNLRNLEKKGFIKRHHINGRSNEYDFQPLLERLESYAHPIQKRIPSRSNLNSRPYSNMNTKEDALNKTKIRKRNGKSGKLTSLGEVLSNKPWS